MTNVPTRFLLQQRLAKHLETLVDEDGNEMDFTGAVFVGKTLLGVNASRPLGTLSILEAPRADIATYAGEEAFMRKDHLTLLISGQVKEDALEPGREGHYLAAAVQQRLYRIVEHKGGGRGPAYPEEYMLGNLITSMEVAPPVVRLPEDVTTSAVGYFFLPIRVGIAVKFGEPYTQVPDET